MSESKTPGPWMWVTRSPETMLEPGVLALYESHGGGYTPDWADACVIEAAPDLLDALIALIDCDDDERAAATALARAAVARATRQERTAP